MQLVVACFPLARRGMYYRCVGGGRGVGVQSQGTIVCTTKEKERKKCGLKN